MDILEIITEALGAQEVLIESHKVNRKDLRLEIFLRQRKESCRCHECGTLLRDTHQWRPRLIRAAPMGPFVEVIICLKQLRAVCDFCDGKVRSARVDFIHPQFQNMTLAMAEHAGRMMEEMTCAAVARLLRMKERTMWDLDQWRMNKMKAHLKIPEGIDLSHMSADEVHFRTLPKPDSLTRPEIQFATNLVCYKESKVLANAMGRDSKALRNCLKTLTEPQRLSIHFFAVDMHDPFISVISKMCPNTSIAVDRYHLAERINKCFDEVRREEFHKARQNKDHFQEGMLSPSRRFVLVEKEKKLSSGDLKMLERLKELNSNILNAMILVEHFHTLLDKKDVAEFRKGLTLWYGLVRESKLKAFRDFAKTLRKYRLNIESYVRSRLTTAVSEGLNNKIKVLKRMAYGYTNQESFLNKILQRCGYLNSRHINTNNWFWTLPPDPGGLAFDTPH